jgi:hypothetical protein
MLALSALNLLSLLFIPEDWGSMFLWSINQLLPGYMAVPLVSNMGPSYLTLSAPKFFAYYMVSQTMGHNPPETAEF